MSKLDFSKLTIGNPSFEAFWHNDQQEFIYVDKTERLVSLLKNNKGVIAIFRPRRFGKSLLLDTAATLISKGVAPFAHTWLGEHPEEWTEDTYPVIRLDFSNISTYTPAEAERNETVSFRVDIYLNILDCLSDYDIQVDIDPNDRNLTFSAFFKKVFKYTSQQKIALIIDEYDAPLNECLRPQDASVFNYREEILRSFYKAIKSYSGHFKWIFITGITQYSIGLFSGFNSVTKLTFNGDYSDLLGFTTEDIVKYYRPYLTHAAKCCPPFLDVMVLPYKLDLPPEVQSKLSPAELGILSRMAWWYDGYRFTNDNEKRVYNPVSVLSFLSAPHLGFKNFWLQTGGALPTILQQLVPQSSGAAQRYLDLLDLKSTVSIREDHLVLVNRAKPQHLQETDHTGLAAPANTNQISETELDALLYMAGYLTIKDGNGPYLRLAIPNHEVCFAFGYLIDTYFNHEAGYYLTLPAVSYIRQALESQDLSLLQQCFTALINENAYDAIKVFNEACYRDQIYKYLTLATIFSNREYPTDNGRIDILAKITKSLGYVFELKLVSSDDKVEAAAQIGAKQIINRGYGALAQYAQVLGFVIVIVNPYADKRDISEQLIAPARTNTLGQASTNALEQASTNALGQARATAYEAPSQVKLSKDSAEVLRQSGLLSASEFAELEPLWANKKKSEIPLTLPTVNAVRQRISSFTHMLSLVSSNSWSSKVGMAGHHLHVFKIAEPIYPKLKPFDTSKDIEILGIPTTAIPATDKKTSTSKTSAKGISNKGTAQKKTTAIAKAPTKASTSTKRTAKTSR